MTPRGSTLTDRQVENVLSGRNTEADLVVLTEGIDALRSLRDIVPTEPPADLVARAAAIARGGAPQPSPRPVKSRRHRVWRLAPAAAAATLSLTLAAPLAVLADTSAPNDLLYSVDLFFERFGIGAGGLAERLDEVNTLTERGDADDAGQHLSEAIAAASPEEVTTHAGEIKAMTKNLNPRRSDTPSSQGGAADNPNKGPDNNSGNSSGPEPGSGNTGGDNPNKGPENNSGNPSNPDKDNPSHGSDSSDNQGKSGEDNSNKGSNNPGNPGSNGDSKGPAKNSGSD